MKEESILKVTRYLEGDMETQERIDFAKELERDADLRKTVEQYKELHSTLKAKLAPDSGDQQIRETLNTMNQQYFKNEVTTAKKEAKVFSLKPYIKYISIAAVLVIGLLLWAPWSGGLYKKYSISKEMSVAERGASSQNPIAEGALLYNKGDYEGAKKIFQKEYMMNPQNPMLSYYFAITLIETSKTYEARTVLIHLYNGESVFKYDAAYYVALSFVKEGNKPEAIQWLNKIPAETANYTKAQALVAELK
ncbi:MAG: hypothetical protein EOO92_04940 [Pedobacter sp.]|nr:MAG: hypothetical protein EOO92_04940 [Pedobacter sp.]